jgi:hypothetical protein
LFESGDNWPAFSSSHQQAPGARHAVDLALNGEEFIDPTDGFDGQRRLAQIG